MSNPYSELDDFCFWSRAMSWPAPGQIDPVVGKAEILPAHPIIRVALLRHGTGSRRNG